MTYKKIRDSRARFIINPIARPIRIAVDKVQDFGRPSEEKKKYIPETYSIEIKL